MKMLVVFEKKDRLRHVGHLDLMRAMQRALRRSGVPIAFSKGFNPHLLLTFAAPLSVGMPGLREVMEVPLSEEISEDEFKEKLRAALPPELPCIAVRAVDDRHPAPMALLYAASYRISVKEDAEVMIGAIPSFMARNSVMAIRKTKSGEKLIDIRPMVYDLKAMDQETIACTLALCEAATCKPELLMDALAHEAGLESHPRAICVRTQLYGKDLVPLELL
ncbi:MAG: DUF2344 domain-containing protein [Clostridia bacterium]|nr:DUF2344 domain-containing protein [Clostridia bacterium]